MHDNPGYPWTLQELADRVGMSRTVFAQKFRKKVAMTPMDYLIRWRMMIAADRLSSTQDSISQISSSLGYETESAFGRVYKKVWGAFTWKASTPSSSSQVIVTSSCQSVCTHASTGPSSAHVAGDDFRFTHNSQSTHYRRHREADASLNEAALR